ncbi:MAG: adenylate/guanylate cyclase domain-containing protein [bacterium]|nr:adenylate/guanylate cyclase domain-containing protein [bacterium]
MSIAVAMQMDDVNSLIRREGLPEIEMGIGIHTGDVVVGNIGSQQRTKYGAVGSTVNLTGRIESYTTGNQVLISPITYEAMASFVTSRQQLTVEPKGVPAPITIYEVSGIAGVHQLFLPDHTEVLTPLDEAIPVRYTVLEGKFAGGYRVYRPVGKAVHAGGGTVYRPSHRCTQKSQTPTPAR